jgi:hypothetical protein
MDHFGLFLTVSNCFWPFLANLGRFMPFEPFKTVSHHFEAVFGLVRKLILVYGKKTPKAGQNCQPKSPDCRPYALVYRGTINRPNQTILGCYRPFQTVKDHFGQIQAI